jgi:hypothetical protein
MNKKEYICKEKEVTDSKKEYLHKGKVWNNIKNKNLIVKMV